MKYATIFYLALVAACLGLLLWLIEQRDREQRIAHALPSALFPGYNPADIDRLRIERDDWHVEIERRDRDWHIVRPFSGRADAARIHHIVAYVDRLPVREKLTREQRETRGLALRHFGLDAPRIRVTLADAEREYNLWVGVETPLKDGLYIQTPAMPHIVLTDRTLSDVLPRSKNDLRDRSVFNGIPAETVRVDIRPYGAAYIQLARDEGGDWTLRQPFVARADREAIHQRLDKLFEARVQRFLPEDAGALLADYGLEDAEAAVRVSVWGTQTDNGMDVFFGRPVETDEGLVYARHGDQSGVFTVSRHLRDAFLAGPHTFRDPRLFRIDPGDVAGLEIRDGDDALTLRRRDHHWQVVQPVQWDADGGKVMEMVVHACELQVRDIVDDPPTNLAALGLSPSRYGLALWRRPDRDATNAFVLAREPAQQVWIGARTRDGEAYYARAQGDESIVTLSAAQLDGRLIGANHAGLPFTDPLIYHARSVLAVATQTVRRIEIQRGETHQIVERVPDGEWMAVQPEGGNVDVEQVKTVLALVETLQALRVEQRGIDQPAAFGFDRPGLKLTLEFSGAGSLSTTLISGFRARTDGIFAMVQGRDLVFAIGRDIIDRLNHDLIRAPADNP